MNDIQHMATGDFAVVTIDGTVGKLIRIGQWLCEGSYVNYEHAFIYLGPEYGFDNIIEAEPKGARLSTLYQYNMKKLAWYSCPEEKRQLVVQQAIKLIGTPYSFLDYLAIALVHQSTLVRNTLGKLVTGYVANTGHMICSQLVDEAYKRAGVNLFSDGRVPGDVTPADLCELITQQRLGSIEA